ncbi:hypothetical protein [Rhodococcus sp. NPDC058521]|uniref:hypothetical protein n=1 Tax=Rhodococcus sp. NPDC058521 TaxID=3346536 RepID=UPI0036482581
MNESRKFLFFIGGLAALFVVTLVIGRTIGPDQSEPDDSMSHTSHGNYTLEPVTAEFPLGTDTPLQFRVLDSDGNPVTEYTEQHEKLLHLIVVRDDTSGYQHLHPTMSDDGTWTVTTSFTDPGQYGLYADFVPAGGENAVATADVTVHGQGAPKPLPPVSNTATVDGYTVTLDGTIAAGSPSTVTMSVTRGGAPVTDLQPYLGAYGHLVAIDGDNLDYLHVHPTGHPGDGVTTAGPGIQFELTAPEPGDYRLFLDFQHGDNVRTAEFSVTAQPGGSTNTPPSEHGHGH